MLVVKQLPSFHRNYPRHERSLRYRPSICHFGHEGHAGIATEIWERRELKKVHYPTELKGTWVVRVPDCQSGQLSQIHLWEKLEQNVLKSLPFGDDAARERLRRNERSLPVNIHQESSP
jgi:hypothetical protein